MNQICQAAGVPKVTAHGMRGLHSTLAVENGVSAHVVAAALGHESSATTMQSYARREAVSGGSAATGDDRPQGRPTAPPEWKRLLRNRFRLTSDKKILSNFVEMNGIEPSAS